jgi:hypothetical protein
MSVAMNMPLYLRAARNKKSPGWPGIAVLRFIRACG